MIKKLYNITIKIIKKLFIPIYYSYIGYQIYYFTQKLSGFKKERQKIYNKIGYYPDYKNPKSFNEKIFWKKVYDRNPLLPIVTDKYRVREYVEKVLSQSEVKNILVPLYYVTDNPEAIPFDNLSEEYVIKPNHSSGKVILAEKIEGQIIFKILSKKVNVEFHDSAQTRREIIDICKNWLSKPYAFHHHEWAYQKIKRKIVIEKLLRDNSGRIPPEYRFYMFHGICKLIEVYSKGFEDSDYVYYNQNWEIVSIIWGKKGTHVKKPKVLSEMILIAEKLSAGFDHIRIDLYLINNHIYFGELTNYTASGSLPIYPVSYDFELGVQWKIVPSYWKYINSLH